MSRGVSETVLAGDEIEGRGLTMAYLLLSRDADGFLQLLSEASFPSRHDALAELSTITGSIEFNSWASEVFLVDLDAATPVLLVRPAPSLPMSEIEISTLETPSIPVAAGEPAPFEYAQEDIGFAEVPGAEDSEGAIGAAAFLADVETKPVGDPAIADAIAEAASEPTPFAGVGHGRPAREASGDELRAALRRSAAQMQDDGVAVPQAAAAADEPVPVAEQATSGFDADAPSAAPAEAAEAPTTVWEPLSPPVPAEEAVSQAQPAPEAASAPVPEQTSVGSASFAAETVVAQAPVPTPWPWDMAAPETAEAERAAAEPLQADSDVLHAGATEGEAPRLEASPPSVTGGSDFILDLDEPASEEPVVVVEPAARPAEVEPPLSTALDAYVCDDCAYAETCPNKNQRLPKECGSFQWR